ncbi:MAG: hypothetical protein NC240_07510 [Clostridium sp.]|nr:hypothetical protein [Clostridium sp.]
METSSYIYKGGRRVLLLVTIFLSSFLINLFIRRGLSFEYLTLSAYDMRDVLSSRMAPSIIYIIFKRGKQLAIIWMLMKVLKTEYVYNTLLVIMSGMFGIMATVQCYYLGLNGMLTLLIFLLPHYIVYFLIIKFLYDYYGGGGYEKTKILILFAILFSIGVMCEGFFSRFFLFKYYQYMVLG